MRERRLVTILLMVVMVGAWAPRALAATGFRQVQSGVGFSATIQRIRGFLRQHHVPLIKIIHHAAMAHRVGIALAPEELMIFGSPKVGAKLMQENPRIGVDLPMKVIVWCAGGHECRQPGSVWVGFDRPTYLAQRFGLSPSQPIIRHLHGFFAGLARVVAAR